MVEAGKLSPQPFLVLVALPKKEKLLCHGSSAQEKESELGEG